MEFNLQAPYKPMGDQPNAIERLTQGLNDKERFQTLLGVTGSGKTFSMANIIQKVQRPTLIISHNKTLAAQLCQEFRSFFPDNAVEYFVSYYDYYQPEAYMPASDTYIDKESSINDQIDRLRHSATMALFERRDVIVVASVSCIYGLGTPEDYIQGAILLKKSNGKPLHFQERYKSRIARDELLRLLVSVKYERNDLDLARGRFRVRGDVVEIYPSYEESVFRIELFGDEIEKIVKVSPVTGEILENRDFLAIYPATHYVILESKLAGAIRNIEAELEERLEYFKRKDRVLEAQRLEQRTNFDLEMIRETGYCHGIENYSRYFAGRAAGEPSSTLLDFFPEDSLMFIDESHVTVPQVRAMWGGDRARKDTLVNYGFRLPSAYDNRPLTFEEFESHMNQVIFVSATPSDYEKKHSKQTVEQIIRPTGLIDPEVILQPIKGQIEDLLKRIKDRVAKKERALVTTLTKRMAEDLTDYLLEKGIKVRYLHSDVATLDRIDILRGLRLGEFDVLVGINLLREGLDLPEVSLVAILDADKEGFLRAETALIQTIGRAARNVNGQVVLYADVQTGSIQRALKETNRRRKIQMQYNKDNNITPQTIIKEIKDINEGMKQAKVDEIKNLKKFIPKEEVNDLIRKMEEEMLTASIALEFERAAEIRDKLKELRKAFKMK